MGSAASFAQERWFRNSRNGLVRDNVVLAWRLDGDIDCSVLQHALGETIRRHETMRTALQAIDGTVMQVILPSVPPDIPAVDLSGLVVSERQQRLDRLIEAEVLRPIDLTRAPLFRSSLVRLDPGSYVLLMTVAHAIWDERSTEVFTREMSVLYRSFLRGEPSSLPELAIQFADFAVWERQSPAPAVASYWKRQLEGIPDQRERKSANDPSVGYVLQRDRFCAASSATIGAITSSAREHGATLYVALVAAFAAVVSKLMAQRDVVIAMTDANRDLVETTNLIGCCADHLLLRVLIHASHRFDRIVADVRNNMLELHAHKTAFGNLPLSTFDETGEIKPCFDFLLDFSAYDGRDHDKASIVDAVMRPCRVSIPHRSYPSDYLWHRAGLVLSLVQDETGQVAGRFFWRPDTFDVRVIDQFARSFTDVLSSGASELHHSRLRLASDG